MAHVFIQTRAFGAKRFRSVELVEADQAKARMAELQREYPMSDYRLAEVAPKRRRRLREHF